MSKRLVGNYGQPEMGEVEPVLEGRFYVDSISSISSFSKVTERSGNRSYLFPGSEERTAETLSSAVLITEKDVIIIPRRRI